MKMYLFLFALLAVCCSQTLYAQKQGKDYIDSCLTVLSKEKEDSVRVKLLLNISIEFNNIQQFDTSRFYATKGLELSKKLNNKLAEAKAFNIIGVSHFFQGHNKEALQSWEQSLEAAKLANNKAVEYSDKLNIANVFMAVGNSPEALKNYFDLLKYYESVKNDKEIATCLGNIANVYLIQNDFAKALEYFLNAEKLFDKIGAADMQADNLYNIGTTYLKLNQAQKAEEYYAKTLAISEKNNLGMGIASALAGIGHTKKQQGNWIEALGYLERANNMYKQMGNTDGMGSTLEDIGSLYGTLVEKEDKTALDKLCGGDKIKALTLARNKIDSAITIFKQTGNIEYLSISYQEMSGVESLRGDYKAALQNYTLFKTLNDSLFNIEKDKKLTQSAMQYDFDKKESLAKVEQDKKNIKQRNIRNSISAGLAGALVFSVVVFRQRNKVKKEKKNVEKEKARSEELLLNILPAEVAEELKEKGTSEARLIDEVTVLFTDFKGFTQLSEKLSPKALVAEINSCFSAFDHIMHKYGVEKIKTIGDSYMAAGGLPVPTTTHPFDVVNAALEIQQYMHDHKMKKEAAGELFFEIRIGVHTGPVVAGIVGVKKFQYDIWGDTVNTASRMESSAEVGKVNISETTYVLVKDKFTCTYRGEIDAKGKGKLKMYYVG